MKNREIKFRAWRILNKEMIYPFAKTPFNTLSSGDLLSRFDNENIMQFTGLHDKNGKEIYEGDILERFAIVQKGANPRQRSVVKWNLFHWAGINQWMQSEVIGNIFENPELLNQ